MREGWTYKTFGDVGSFLRGKSIQKADFVEKGLPCIHYGQIHTKFGVSVDKHLTEIPSDIYEKSIIASPGDVIIAITSEDLEGSCKSTAWLGDYDVAVSAHAAVYKHNLNPKYIVYYLRSNSFYVEKEKYARGFKVMEIKPTDIARILIPIPPISIQQSIVAELDKINELIGLKKSQLSDLDSLAQSIFYEMFGDPVENEKGWEVKKLNEVSESITDGDHMPPPKSERGIPFLTISDINKETRELDFSNTFFVPQDYYDGLKEERKARTNDLLYTVTGSYGIPVIVKTDKQFCFQRHIALIRPMQKMLTTTFLCYWALSPSIKGVADRVATGIAQKTVGLNSIRKFDIVLPPLPLQQSFAARIIAIEQQKQRISSSIKDLETLLASRMQYWFD